MPRYYLHVCDGSGFCEDEEGLDLSDLSAARVAAIDGLRDIVAGEIRAGTLRRAAFVEIEDEHHKLILTITFEEAVQEPAAEAPPRR